MTFNACIADAPHLMHITKFLCHHDITSFCDVMTSLMTSSHAHVAGHMTFYYKRGCTLWGDGSVT